MSITTFRLITLLVIAAQSVEFALVTVGSVTSGLRLVPRGAHIPVQSIGMMVLALSHPLAQICFFICLYREIYNSTFRDLRRAAAVATLCLTLLMFCFILSSYRMMPWSNLPEGYAWQTILTAVRTVVWNICWPAALVIFASKGEPLQSASLRKLALVLGAITVVGGVTRAVGTFRVGWLSPYALVHLVSWATLALFFFAIPRLRSDPATAR